jgi:hypothetical protein
MQMETSEELAPGRPAHITRIRLAILLVGPILLIAYSVPALNSQDPLWFVNRFDRRPVQIIIHDQYGQSIDLWPGHPDFEPLAEAVRACLSQGLRQPSGLSLSDASLSSTNTRTVTVEAVFLRPVRLHTWFATEESTRMLFPITDRHPELALVILGQQDHYLSSPPVLRTVEPLREAMRGLGYY